MGRGIVRIRRNRRVEAGERGALCGFVGTQVVERTAAQIVVVGRNVGRATGARQILVGAAVRLVGCRHLVCERARDRIGDLALHGEDIAHAAVEGPRPAAEAGRAIDEIGGDPHDFARAAHAAVEQECNAERRRDGLRVILAIAEFPDDVSAITSSRMLRASVARTSSDRPSEK